jgi:hypothetical protein
MRDYTKIKAWQLADDLTVAIYGATKSFPKDELYSLTNQIRRAAYSVPANPVKQTMFYVYVLKVKGIITFTLGIRAI